MERAYVNCHMVVSSDGCVTGEFLSRERNAQAIEDYYEINRNFLKNGYNAYACGRVTMQSSFTQGWYPDLTVFDNTCVQKEDYIADVTANFFAVAFDRYGRLGWKDGKINDFDPGYDKAHIVEVLTENVDDRFLKYLQMFKISYIFAGKDDIDINLALVKLKKLFKIDKLLLEGGSIINGAFRRASCIDELSLVRVDDNANDGDLPLFYDADENFIVTDIENLPSGAKWIRGKID